MKYENAIVFGLARTLTKLTTFLVEEGVIDSTRAIRSFRGFVETLGEEPEDKISRIWVNHLVEALEADPSRPPAAPVVDLFPESD